MTRRKCEYPDCNRFGRNKGLYKNKIRYDRYCETHHRVRDAYYKGKQTIPNKICELCGWDKAPCDRHRIDPKIGYTKTNIKVLCPNCHRLVTIGIIEL